MSIADNLDALHDQIGDACRAANRSPTEVVLMAVSKVHPVELLLEAYAAGQRVFGENRVQEFAEKSARLGHLSDLDMHLIGPLQSNKSTRAAELFSSIDTVDSLKLAQRLNAAALALNKVLPITIEVKLSPEDSKHGIDPLDLPRLLDAIAPFSALRTVGLMTVPPFTEDSEPARPYFRHLRHLRDAALLKHPSVQQLSMGMSNDFAVAIAEGSTCIRIGTAIFGRRPPNHQPAQ